MYETYQPDDADEDAVGIDGASASVVPIGYRLGTDKTRSGLWVFDEGDAGRRHRQTEQEELYHVVEGEVAFEIGPEGETEEVVVGEGGFVVVSPEEPRRLIAREPSRVFAVGAPNTKDDHEVLE